MNRVDLAVFAALEIVRLDRSSQIRFVVTLPMVVLDLEIVILKEALRDDEVMRLVAVGMLRRNRPRGEAECDRRDCAGEERVRRGSRTPRSITCRIRL